MNLKTFTNIQESFTIHTIVQWWLIGILLFLPFQYIITKLILLWNTKLSIYLERLDELTIIILLPIAIIEFYRKKVPIRSLLILLFPLLILSFIGILSGILNKNSLFITAYGIFDYIKYFLVIFIYATFFKEFNEFKKVYHLVLMLAVSVGVIAFIQEIWALVNRYIFQEKFIYPEFELLYSSLNKSEYLRDWRFGIHRVSSLMWNSGNLGLYTLLVLTIYMNIVKKVNFIVFSSLFSGIFGSVSRIVYTGFILLGGLQILRGRKWLILLLLPVLIIPLSYLYFYLTDSGKPLTIEDRLEETWKYHDSLRQYSRAKAMEIWRVHPLFGAGPGMYGGIVSIKYKSPVYEKYNFSQQQKNVMKFGWGIDQFWPQVFAELGIIGAGCFIWIFISLLVILLIFLKKKTTSNEMKGLFRGLITYVFIILIHTFGGILNITHVIFTFFAFVGMGLGSGIRCSAK